MSNDFDPYSLWFDIPVTNRPLNHYQLLGLALFESNASKIKSAYYRRVVAASAYQDGSFALKCAQVLKELSEAKDTLLDSVKRGQYDKSLRDQFRAQTTGGSPSGRAPFPSNTAERTKPIAPSSPLTARTPSPPKQTAGVAPHTSPARELTRSVSNQRSPTTTIALPAPTWDATSPSHPLRLAYSRFARSLANSLKNISIREACRLIKHVLSWKVKTFLASSSATT